MSPAQQVEVSITTQSQMMQFPAPPPIYPKITMNGTPIPTPAGKSAYPTGWQVIVIDAFKDMTDPASIITNKYISLTVGSGNVWGSTYQYMYRSMVRESLLAGNLQQQLVILVSYGLDQNMPPSNDGLELLMEYGGGAALQNWEMHCNPGSQAGGEKQLVGIPVNYILVGRSSDSYGMGNEKFEQGNPIQSNLTVTLRNPVPPS